VRTVADPQKAASMASPTSGAGQEVPHAEPPTEYASLSAEVCRLEKELLGENAAPHTLEEMTVFSKDTRYLEESRLAFAEAKAAALMTAGDGAASEETARENVESLWCAKELTAVGDLAPQVERISTYLAQANLRESLLAQLRRVNDALVRAAESKESDSTATTMATALGISGGGNCGDSGRVSEHNDGKPDPDEASTQEGLPPGANAVSMSGKKACVASEVELDDAKAAPETVVQAPAAAETLPSVSKTATKGAGGGAPTLVGSKKRKSAKDTNGITSAPDAAKRKKQDDAAGRAVAVAADAFTTSEQFETTRFPAPGPKASIEASGSGFASAYEFGYKFQAEDHSAGKPQALEAQQVNVQQQMRTAMTVESEIRTAMQGLPPVLMNRLLVRTTTVMDTDTHARGLAGLGWDPSPCFELSQGGYLAGVLAGHTTTMAILTWESPLDDLVGWCQCLFEPRAAIVSRHVDTALHLHHIRKRPCRILVAAVVDEFDLKRCFRPDL